MIPRSWQRLLLTSTDFRHHMATIRIDLAVLEEHFPDQVEDE
jgi:hypothetical protein